MVLLFKLHSVHPSSTHTPLLCINREPAEAGGREMSTARDMALSFTMALRKPVGDTTETMSMFYGLSINCHGMCSDVTATGLNMHMYGISSL